VARTHGAGRVIFLGFEAGTAAFLPPARRANPDGLSVPRDNAYSLTQAEMNDRAAMSRLLKAIVGEYVGAPRMVTNVPDGVAVFADTHADGARRWLNVHLLNATQSALRPGMKVPLSYEVPWDKVALADASVRLALPQGAQVAEVRLMTPDKDASKEFDWSIAEGAVVLKPRDLVRYSIFSVVLK
jgi:hypothetical protein